MARSKKVYVKMGDSAQYAGTWAARRWHLHRYAPTKSPCSRFVQLALVTR
jgi:hypothetical protein